MHRLNFKQKLWLPLAVSLLALLAVSVSAAWLSRETRIEERKHDLVNVGHVGLSIVKQYAALAASGALSEAEARKQALERLRDIRYGEDGYFLVLDSKPRMIMHAMKPATNGKDLAGVEDADGRHHYVTFATVAQAPEGGFVDYVFPHPGNPPSAAVDKIGYVVRYAPWDWIIATGAYVDDIDAAFRRSLYMLGAVVGAVALLVSALVAFTNRSIQRTIGGDPTYVAQVAGEISKGNLVIPIALRSGDDYSLLHTMRQMRDALAGTIVQISGAADKVATGAREIAQGNTDLSARTESQAASLEETAASMEQMTAMVRQTSESAQTASQLTASAEQIVMQGGQMAAEAVTTMQEISTESHKMVEIIAVIEGIAFQTNILALNAAVEAARAGRGTGARLRGGGRRSAHAGAAQCVGGQRNPRADQPRGGARGERRRTRRQDRLHDSGGERGHCEAVGRDARYCGGCRRAERGHRPGGRRRLADGQRHPTERRAGRAGRRGRADVDRAGKAAGGVDPHLPGGGGYA